MSINNLSNGCNGLGQLNSRPTFLRDDGPPALINTVDRYTMQGSSAANGNGEGTRLLFDGGDARPDFRAIAQALLARLDALRERYDNQFGQDAGEQPSGDETGESMMRSNGSFGGHQGWWHGNNWYNTGGAPNSGSSTGASVPTTPTAPVQTQTQTSSPPPASTNSSGEATGSGSSPTPTVPAGSTPPASAPAPVVLGNTSSSNSIHLNSGETTIANTTITGNTGIVGDNATHVTTLNVSNVVIQSTNYGIYLGECDNLNLANVNITCDPSGGDSYSIRGYVRNFVSSDSTFNSGIKAFRLYGVEGGSSTRDTITGDRLMLGGGYSYEWGEAGAFHNFTFTDGAVDVNSVELYNNTSNVVFENMDFSGTGHISIQAGAHDIVFRNCTNLPQIRLYDTSGNWTPLPADASRNIVVTN